MCKTRLIFPRINGPIVAFSRGLLRQTLKIESLLSASRLPNTCYRVELLLGDIFYLSLRFSPVAEGNEESLRSGAVFVGYTSLMYFFFLLLLFFSRASKINMNMEE